MTSSAADAVEMTGKALATRSSASDLLHRRGAALPSPGGGLPHCFLDTSKKAPTTLRTTDDRDGTTATTVTVVDDVAPPANGGAFHEYVDDDEGRDRQQQRVLSLQSGSYVFAGEDLTIQVRGGGGDESTGGGLGSNQKAASQGPTTRETVQSPRRVRSGLSSRGGAHATGAAPLGNGGGRSTGSNSAMQLPRPRATALQGAQLPQHGTPAIEAMVAAPVPKMEVDDPPPPFSPNTVLDALSGAMTHQDGGSGDEDDGIHGDRQGEHHPHDGDSHLHLPEGASPTSPSARRRAAFIRHGDRSDSSSLQADGGDEPVIIAVLPQAVPPESTKSSAHAAVARGGAPFRRRGSAAEGGVRPPPLAKQMRTANVIAMMTESHEPHAWIVAHEPQKALSVHAFVDIGDAVRYISDAKLQAYERERRRVSRRSQRRAAKRQQRASAMETDETARCASDDAVAVDEVVPVLSGADSSKKQEAADHSHHRLGNPSSAALHPPPPLAGHNSQTYLSLRHAKTMPILHNASSLAVGTSAAAMGRPTSSESPPPLIPPSGLMASALPTSAIREPSSSNHRTPQPAPPSPAELLSSTTAFSNAAPPPTNQPMIISVSSPQLDTEATRPSSATGHPGAAIGKQQGASLSSSHHHRVTATATASASSFLRFPLDRPLTEAPRIRGPSTSNTTTGTTTSCVTDSSDTDTEDEDDEYDFVAWLDLQVDNEAAIRTVLAEFPIREATKRHIFQPQFQDAVHAQTADAYVFIVALGATRAGHTYHSRGASTTSSDGGSDAEERWCSGGAPTTTTPLFSSPLFIIAFSDWIITIHCAPIKGLSETLTLVQSTFSGVRRRRKALLAMNTPSAVQGGNSWLEPQQMLLVAWLFAVLLDFVVMEAMPDTVRLLAEAKAVDEMILSTPDRDRPDLLLRIAYVRQRLSTERMLLASKERFLHQLSTAPMIRASCLGRKTAIEQLDFTHRSVGYVASRIDAASSVLNEASDKFVTHVSLQMTVLSTRLNRTMKALSQIATIAVPLNLVTGLFGMNVTVPFQTGTDPMAQSLINVTPFLCILLAMLLYAVVAFPVVYRSLQRGREADERLGGVAERDADLGRGDAKTEARAERRLGRGGVDMV